MSSNDAVIQMESNNTSNFVSYNPVTTEVISEADLEAIYNYIVGNDRILILESFAEERCRTPLHDVCACEDIAAANVLLEKILEWYESSEPPKGDKFIHKLDQTGKNALHYALKRNNLKAVEALIARRATLYVTLMSAEVKKGKVKVLKDYVDDRGHYIKLASEDERRTPLHDICDCEDKDAAKEMLDKVLKWYARSEPPEDDTFINEQDQHGNTALHYALMNKNRYAVNALIASGAFVHVPNNKKEEAVTGIYELFPKTIMTLLGGKNQDQRIQFGKDEDQEDDDDDKLKITCDFGAVIGIDLDRSKIYETYLLSNVLHLEKQTQAILDFLIVQLFLDLKWGRMRWLIYFSMAFHASWSALSAYVVGNIFLTKYGNGTNISQQWKQLENEKWDHFNYKMTGLIFVLIIFTIFMLIKEVVEFMATRHKKIYLYQMENWSQLLLIGLIIILLINLILPNSLRFPVWLDFIFSIVAVMTSCLLVVGQLNKKPNLGLYMAMFMEVLRNFGWLFLWFSPILFAFTAGFRMFMPLNEEFQLFWPPFGLIKIVAMSTGEYNYDDIYEHEVDAIKLLKNILIFFFIIMVGIVLSNLLIGLVVSDLTSLQKTARVNSLNTQLEQMYLMEAFITKRLGGDSRLAEACRVTGNPSFWKVPPLSWLNSLREKPWIRNTSAPTSSDTSTGPDTQNPDTEEHPSDENRSLTASTEQQVPTGSLPEQSASIGQQPTRSTPNVQRNLWSTIRNSFLSSSHTSNEQYALVPITEQPQSGGIISNEQNTSVVPTEQKQPSGRITNEQSTSVAQKKQQQPSGNESHVIKKLMKDFGLESKIRLMELKKVRDDTK